MRTIRQALNRRSDLSSFVVHLTKTVGDQSALANLTNILVNGRIEARSFYGWAKREWIHSEWESQKVACFSEAPLQEIQGLLDIEDRQVKLEPYGVVFTKMVARRKGANPVWYVDTRPDYEGNLADALDALLAEANGGARAFADYESSKLFPFIEEMGESKLGNRKEFWWERESGVTSVTSSSRLRKQHSSSRQKKPIPSWPRMRQRW